MLNLIIYRATNKYNGKIYIGQTSLHLARRIWLHHQATKNGLDEMVFHKAIRKYGEDAFLWDILVRCDTNEEMNRLESGFIKLLNSKVPNGYNLTDGGENNSGSNNPMFGKKQSAYCRSKNRQMRIGQRQSPEFVEKRVSQIRGNRHYLRNGSDKGKQFIQRLKERVAKKPISCRYIWVIKSRQFGVEEFLNLRDWSNKHNLNYHSARGAFYGFGHYKEFLLLGRKLCLMG